MLVLHGIYDHGKVEITDKNLPDIKTEVEIQLNELQEKSADTGLKDILGKYHFGKQLDKKNIRDILYE